MCQSIALLLLLLLSGFTVITVIGHDGYTRNAYFVLFVNVQIQHFIVFGSLDNNHI